VGRVLVVTAHPDDVDFTAAGTVATFVAAGVEVAYCIATSGEAGGNDVTVPRAEMAAVRQAEQRAAAAELGVADVTFLGYPDGCLQPTIELRRDISREIRRFRPDRVLAPSPQRNWASVYGDHPDHLAAGEAAACAVYPDARNPFAHPELLDEGLDPHTVTELWLMAAPQPTVTVDITAVFGRKLAALRRHVSQVGAGEHLEAMLREWNGAQSRAAGLAEGRLAESFRSFATS
jgi:LmbE family N-acetylglucosaminyl deacetylase